MISSVCHVVHDRATIHERSVYYSNAGHVCSPHGGNLFNEMIPYANVPHKLTHCISRRE